MNRVWSVACAAAAFATNAQGTPLTMVEVGAPAINCVFNASCKITVSDTTDSITLSGSADSGFLQSRTFVGAPGAPASGRYGYQYRIDLRYLLGILDIPCVTSFKIKTGPLVGSLDYNGDAATGEQIYVVTSGGLGNIKPSAADQAGGTVTFTFGPPVCAGGAPGNGDSSFFFGFASAYPPHFVTAQITDLASLDYHLEARAPTSLIWISIDTLKKFLETLSLESIDWPSRSARAGWRAGLVQRVEKAERLVEKDRPDRALALLRDLQADLQQRFGGRVVDDPATKADEPAELHRALEQALGAFARRPERSQTKPSSH